MCISICTKQRTTSLFLLVNRRSTYTYIYDYLIRIQPEGYRHKVQNSDVTTKDTVSIAFEMWVRSDFFSGNFFTKNLPSIWYIKYCCNFKGVLACIYLVRVGWWGFYGGYNNNEHMIYLYQSVYYDKLQCKRGPACDKLWSRDSDSPSLSLLLLRPPDFRLSIIIIRSAFTCLVSLLVIISTCWQSISQQY